MERRMEILRAIVEDYVATHEPVGSKVLAARHGLSISPATIRNEMAALEEEGLIIQPHTSAGRIPTDLGYRVFVDRLSSVKPLSAPEKRAIDKFLEGAVDLDDVVARTVRLLAQVTHQVAIVQYPSLKRSSVRHIEVLSLAPNRLMLVLIADTGRVEQRILDLRHELPENVLNELRAKLNAQTVGKKLGALPTLLDTFEKSFPRETEVSVSSVISVILEMAIERNEERVVISGTSNLARHAPDFNESVHPVLEALEEQVVLLRLLGEAVDYVKTELMPDFDFDAFNHEDSENNGEYTPATQPTAAAPQQVATPIVEEVPDVDPETITEKKPLEARDTPASAGDNLSSEEVDKC